MRVEATVSFQGDFGPGTPVVSYDAGQTFEAPDRIGHKWIGRGLIRPAPATKKANREMTDNGE